MRLGIGAAFAALLIVLAVVSQLWVRSRASEAQALQQARRAEAQQLFALGQVEDEANPTLAFAYAIAALERADTDGDPAIRAPTTVERTTGVCRQRGQQRRRIEPCVQPGRRMAGGLRAQSARVAAGWVGAAECWAFVRRQRRRTLRR